MDHVEERNRVGGLVRLKLADQVKRDAGIGCAQIGPFGGGLLHPVFTEDAVSRLEQRADRVGIMRLRHRDQGRGRVLAQLRGMLKLGGDGGKAGNAVVGHARRYNAPDGRPIPRDMADDRRAARGGALDRAVQAATRIGGGVPSPRDAPGRAACDSPPGPANR